MWMSCITCMICAAHTVLDLCSPGETKGDRAAGLWKCVGAEEDTDPQWCPQRHAAVPPGGLWGEFHTCFVHITRTEPVLRWVAGIILLSIESLPVEVMSRWYVAEGALMTLPDRRFDCSFNCCRKWDSKMSLPYSNKVTPFVFICQKSFFSRPLVCFLCSAHWLSQFFLLRSPVVSTGWGRSQRPYVYILPYCCKREVGGHLFNWLSLPPMLWQSKCYLQPHCSGCTLTLSTMRAENRKWKSGPVLQEIRGAAMRCAECPQIWLRYSVSRSSGKFKESEFSLLHLISVCFNNRDDFTMFCLNVLPVGWARVPCKGSIKVLFISLCEYKIVTKNGKMLPFPPVAETVLPVTAPAPVGLKFPDVYTRKKESNATTCCLINTFMQPLT